MKNLPKGHKMQQKAKVCLCLAEGSGDGECLLLGMKTS